MSSQVFHSDSAETAWSESSAVSLAPEPQYQGRNWKLPSSVPIAENVMPFFPAPLIFSSAAVSDVQSLTEAMSTPAFFRTALL